MSERGEIVKAVAELEAIARSLPHEGSDPNPPGLRLYRVANALKSLETQSTADLEEYRRGDHAFLTEMVDLMSAASESSSALDVRDALLETARAWRERVNVEPPLLQCVDCKNTESPAGAMARYFNQGRCLHCGGWFKVVRA